MVFLSPPWQNFGEGETSTCVLSLPLGKICEIQNTSYIL